MKATGRVAGRLFKPFLALGLLASALPAYRYSQVAYLRENSALAAYKVDPSDPAALAAVYGSRFDANPDYKPDIKDLGQIRTGLVSRPLDAKLLSLIGLLFEAEAGTGNAKAIMTLASKISRRETIAGLYLIEANSADNDVRGAMKHYNALLSTHPEMRETLLPILASAIAFPEVRSAILPYLKGGVNWTGAFLKVASEISTIDDFKYLLPQVGNAIALAEYFPDLSSILRKAALQGRYDDLVFLAKYLIPDFKAEVLGDVSINERTTDQRLGALAWNFPPVENIAIEHSGDRAVTIDADPLARGTVAIRELMLEGGVTYQLSQQISFATEGSRPTIRWSATCLRADGKTALAWDKVEADPRNSLLSKYTFTVPTGCRLIQMALIIEGPDSQVPGTLTLDQLAISRTS